MKLRLLARKRTRFPHNIDHHSHFVHRGVSRRIPIHGSLGSYVCFMFFAFYTSYSLYQSPSVHCCFPSPLLKFLLIPLIPPNTRPVPSLLPACLCSLCRAVRSLSPLFYILFHHVVIHPASRSYHPAVSAPSRDSQHCSTLSLCYLSPLFRRGSPSPDDSLFSLLYILYD